MDTKICSTCKIDKSLELFYKNKTTTSGISYSCKECNDKATIEAKRRKSLGLPSVSEEKPFLHGDPNSPDYKAFVNLKYKYGITIKEYNKMFESQEGRCAICSKHQTELKKRLSVDHSHESGKVRKLLCPTCNHGLGNFKDDIVMLQKAIDYLKDNK